MAKLMSLLLVFVAGMGCGSSTSTPGGGGGGGKICDWVTAGVRSQCIDFGAGWTTLTEGYACVAPQMLVSGGPCPHAGSGGGCTIVSGPATETIWSYGANYDAATVMANCAAKGTYVAP